jgi:hypothetical protein
MSVEDLNVLIEPLKRQVAAPGTFETVFPNSTDEILFGYLADALAEAKIDGWFHDVQLDIVTGDLAPPLDDGEGAAIVIYAAASIIRGQLRALSTRRKYKAGPVELQEENASMLLTEDLKALIARKDEIMRRGAGTGTAFVFDAYCSRQYASYISSQHNYSVIEGAY